MMDGERVVELSILIKARGLILDPARWTQGVFTRQRDDGGLRRCALGALVDSATGEEERAYKCAYKTLCAYTSGNSLAEFNDTHTHVEVIALFDKCIAACAVRA